MSGRGTWVGSRGARVRGQSNVIAVVLLTGMVITGATIVVFAGSAALTQNQDDASVDSATHSMQSLDEKIRQVSTGDTSQAEVTLNDRNGDMQMVTESPSDPAKAGKVTITVDPPSAPSYTEDAWLGTVHYERDGQTVAYQGGGVWQRTGNGSTAVSPPDVSYRSDGPRNGTLSFPIVTLDGDVAGSELQIEEVERKSLLGLSNPIKPGTKITVEIRSEYYHAWADELTAELGADAVEEEPSNQKVTVTLDAPLPSSAPSAVLTTSSSGRIDVQNFGQLDSYDSSVEPYDTFPVNNNADVLTEGAIKPSKKMVVRGDVVAEEGLASSKELKNDDEIYGRTILGDDPDIGSSDYLTVKGGGDQKFHGVFSTKDNLEVTAASVFKDDVLVDGDLTIDNDNPVFQNEGDIVVTGDVDQIRKAHITGSLFVNGTANSIGHDVVTIEGDLVVDSDVHLNGDAEVQGEVIIPNGNSVTTSGSPTYTVNKKPRSEVLDILGDAPRPVTPDVPPRESAEDEIDDWASKLGPSTNDNGAEDLIDGHELDFTGTSDHTLEPGEYYLEQLEVPSGDTLTLDTSGGGDVVIYVADNPSNDEVQIDGTINVDGDDVDNKARVYVDSTDGDELEIRGSGKVIVPNDKTGNMWMFLRPGTYAEFKNSAEFQGVLYGADNGASGGAEIKLNNKVKIHGALMGDIQQVPNDAEVHYDEALTDEEALAPPPDITPVNYIYFTQETATVED